MAKDSEVYVLKVALDGRRSIWRRIAIRGDQTLNDLHWTIFHAFDRDDDHLYAYYISADVSKKTRSQVIRNSIRYIHPYALDAYLEREGEEKNAETTTIASLHLTKGQVFYYLFDFGDNWWHVIKVEQTDAEADPALRYPAVIASLGESPAQYEEYDEEE